MSDIDDIRKRLEEDKKAWEKFDFDPKRSRFYKSIADRRKLLDHVEELQIWKARVKRLGLVAVLMEEEGYDYQEQEPEPQ